jgi:hypothetical protein
VSAQQILFFGVINQQQHLMRGAEGDGTKNVKHLIEADTGEDVCQIHDNETAVIFGGGSEVFHRGVVDHDEIPVHTLLGGPVGPPPRLFADPKVGEHCQHHLIGPVLGWACDGDAVFGGGAQDGLW